jgi:hypothetical protein
MQFVVAAFAWRRGRTKRQIWKRAAPQTRLARVNETNSRMEKIIKNHDKKSENSLSLTKNLFLPSRQIQS